VNMIRSWEISPCCGRLSNGDSSLPNQPRAGRKSVAKRGREISVARFNNFYRKEEAKFQ
jgi:hypothetical protein